MNKKIKSVALGLLMSIFPFTTSLAVFELPSKIDFSDDYALYSYAQANADTYKSLRGYNTKLEYKKFINFKRSIFGNFADFFRRYGCKRTILFMLFLAQEVYDMPGLCVNGILIKCDCYCMTFDENEGLLRIELFSKEEKVFELLF